MQGSSRLLEGSATWAEAQRVSRREPARAQEGTRKRSGLEEMGSGVMEVTPVLRSPGRCGGGECRQGASLDAGPGITLSPTLQTEQKHRGTNQSRDRPTPPQLPVWGSSCCVMVFRESRVLPQNHPKPWEGATCLARPRLPTSADQSCIK